MRFTHYLLSEPLDFDDCCIHQLIFENPDDLCKMVMELRNQANGESGSFCLYDGNKSLDISKYVSLILSPLNLDLNSKSILSGLYSKMVDSSNTNHIQKLNSILSDIDSLIVDLSNEQIIEVDRVESLDITSILKIMNIGFEDRSDVLESICDYTSLLYKYTKIKLVIFVSISQYVSFERMKDLIHMLLYNSNPVLFIDTVMVSNECHAHILDGDFCEINVPNDRNIFEV